MKILSVNAGSSSLKFSAYEMPEEKKLMSGYFERIGIGGSFYTLKINGEKIRKEVELNDHEQAVRLLGQELIAYKIVNDLSDIKGIGHRIVQGADLFDKAAIIDDKVLKTIADLSLLAPLHNPAAVVGIKAFMHNIPNAVAVAVFDTAFHQTIPEEAYMYALPYEWYTDHKVRRYGAHGTSHKYLANRVNELLGRTDTKLITCHLGNGGSISAIVNGKCIDTSMGFTPNAGIMMSTRCGDVDVSIIPYIMERLNLSPRDIDNIINKQSGMLGISGVGSDNRDIEDAIAQGNKRAILTQKMFVRSVVNYIARYYVLMGGADAIVFSAGIGENSWDTRKEVIESLAVLGVKLDEQANDKVRGKELLITTSDSSIPCYIIPTDEEIMIARETLDFLE